MNTTRATAEALLERDVEDAEGEAWTREGSGRGEEHVGRAAMLAAVSTNDVRAVREAVDRARDTTTAADTGRKPNCGAAPVKP